MKSRMIIGSIMCLSLMFSCQNANQELAQEDKDAIIKEIDSLWNYSTEGMEIRNWDQAFSIYSDSKHAQTVAYGYIYPSIDTALNQYKRRSNKAASHTPRKLVCDPIFYDFINEKTVVMNTIGSIFELGDSLKLKDPLVVAYTLVWVKESHGWKLRHFHASREY